MAAKDQIDQDALAAEWGVALDAEQGTTAENAPAAEQPADDAEAMASHWATMVDDGQFIQAAKGGAERILTQEEIDSLLGFSLADVNLNDNSGIRAIIDSAMVSYERLPILEIVFHRLVRLMTTSLRNFTSDNVEGSLDNITSIRFGDYLNSIPLPAILAGLRIEGRPYTTIERTLVQRMTEVILQDMCQAFEPLAPVNFTLDRLETNPRFAAIARPANAAILVKLRIDMEDRGGRTELLLPYATLEPIRKLLLQQFMGEKFGRDSIWEGHLASELWSTKVDINAILDEQTMRLNEIMNLQVGQTVMLNATPDSRIEMRCRGVPLLTGRMGRVGSSVAVRVDEAIERTDASRAL